MNRRSGQAINGQLYQHTPVRNFSKGKWPGKEATCRLLVGTAQWANQTKFYSCLPTWSMLVAAKQDTEVVERLVDRAMSTGAFNLAPCRRQYREKSSW